MRSSRFCQGIRESIHSKNCSRRVLRFLPWYSKVGKGGLVHLPSLSLQASAASPLLCHIATDLFRVFLVLTVRSRR